MRRLLITVSLSVILSLLGLFVVRQLVPQRLLLGTNDVVGNYLQTVGTIYAVLLAFVVFVVWNQHNEARGYVEKEANELADLLRIARGLPEPLGNSVRERARSYLDAVIEKEWDTMARGQEFLRARSLLEQLWQDIGDLEPKTEREKILYAEALARFNDLSDARSERLHSSRTRLPSGMWLLIMSGAVIVVSSMYLFSLESFVLHGIMTGAMAGAISHILVLIQELDVCFAGQWQVQRTPFTVVRQQM